MEMENKMKEVDFHTYCNTCKWKDKLETDDPCYDCMAEPANQYSHKPVCYEEP